MDLLVSGSAVFSPCGMFRMRLDRDLGAVGPVVAICGVNPSKAGAKTNDHTMTKIIGFGARLGWARIAMVNKFSLVATDVNALRDAADPVGPQNDRYILEAFAEADLIIPAWGPLSKLPPRLRGRWRDVAAMAQRTGKPVKCWGVAGDGQPRHPLMLSYETPLVPWRAPA